MFLQDIGRTIGQIFGGQPKKRRPDNPQPQLPINNGGRGVGVLQTRYQQPQGIAPTRQPNFQQQTQNAFQPPQQPSTLGQPIQTQPTTVPFKPGYNPNQQPARNPINDVGNFLFSNTAKLANQGFGVVEKAGVNIAGEAQKALGDRTGGQRTIQQGEAGINQRLLQKGSGLFGAGGVYNSTQALHNADPNEVLRKAGGTGLASFGEIAPVGKGINLAKGAVTPNLARLAGQSAAVAGIGSVGGQLAQTGRIDPGETALSAGTGAVLGPASYGAGKLLKPVVDKIGQTGKDVKIRLPQATNEAMSLGKPQVSLKNTNIPQISDPHIQQAVAQLDKPKVSLKQGTKVTQLDSMRNMQDILNNGGTVDEAKAHYITTQKSTLGQADLALQKVLGSKGVDKSAVNAKLNPQYGKPVIGAVAEGNSDQAILNSHAIHASVIDKGNAALSAVKNLSPSDHALMDELRGNSPDSLIHRAENPQAFRQAADATKIFNDYTHAAGSGLLGQNVPYRKNYGASLLFQNTPEEVAAARKAMLKNNPGYGKSRTFQNYEEAAPYGLVRQNQNFGQDIATDAQRRANDLAGLTLHQGLEKAYPGQVMKSEIGVGEGGVYKQLQIPHGSRLSLPAELADKLNARAPKATANKGLKAYDYANARMKYFKLGGGTFHGITEGGNILGQQMISGNLIKHPVQNAKAMAAIFNPKQHEKNMAEFANDGAQYADGVSTIDRARIAGVTLDKTQITSDIEPGKLQNIPVIHQIHEAIFKRQIPEAKLMVIKQMTKGLNMSKPEDVAYIRSVAKGMNKIGGINRAVDGLTPQTAKMVGRGLLATDFTEGRWRTIASALNLSKNSPENKIARQMVVGKTVAFLLPALAAATVAGKIDWNDPKDVAKNIGDQIIDPHFPTDFKTKSGIEKIAKTPETFVSEIGRLIKPVFDGSADPTSGAKHYVTARASAALSLGNQLLTNQDYKGDPIVTKDENGNVNVGESAVNIASNQLPIPAVQGIKTAQGKQGLVEAGINTLGLRSVADPNDPKMKSFNFQNQTLAKLSPKDKALWDSIYGKNEDINGNPINITPALESQAKAHTLLTNPKLIEIGQKLDNYNRQQGLPSDPFFNLDKGKQQTVLNLAIDKFRNPAERSLLKDTNQTWLDPYNKARTAYFDQLNLPPSQKTKELPEPQAPSNYGDYAAISDPSQKRDYLANHPEITDYFTAHEKFIRTGREKQGLPQYDKYPEATPEVQKIMNTYAALPKGESNGKSRIRSSWIKAHPNEWNAMSAQFSRQAQYSLEQDAQRAAYEGQDFSDKGIKDIASLAKDLGGSGTSGGSGSYSKGYSRSGSGGGGSNLGKSPYSYAVSLKSRSKIAKPKVSSKKRQAIKIASKSSKPKVSIKASKV